MAAALEVRLSGPRHYPEGPSDDPFINAEGREPTAKDVGDAAAMTWLGWSVLVIAAAVGWLVT